MLAGGAADFDFESTWRAVQPDDVATLIYTSGTTGNPKGVEMTHANLMFESYAVAEVLDWRFGDRMTSYLPSAHIADRWGGLYGQEVFGTQVTVVPDARAIAAALPDVRPTIWGAVPRVWEKLKAAIEFAAANEPDETKRQGLQWGMAVAAKKAAALVAGEPIADDVAAEWAQADELVLSKLREKLGLEQLRWSVSGAAPIPKETLAFFAGLGIPIAEVWGMSELSCVASVSHPRDARLGTVGKLLPGLEGKIADDGEFLVRGPLVMKGYRKEPKKTAEAVDADGWLHTGDILDIDDDGYLRIVDRKKELIINAGGKNMSPSNIENTIKAACPLIGVIIALGDSRPYNTALIVLDAESAGPYAAQRGLTDASADALAAHPRTDQRDRGRGSRREREAVAGRADQTVPRAADLLGARRRRDHAHDEAQAQADQREIRRRDRGTVRARRGAGGLRAAVVPDAAEHQPDQRACCCSREHRGGSIHADNADDKRHDQPDDQRDDLVQRPRHTGDRYLTGLRGGDRADVLSRRHRFRILPSQYFG